jgi:small subunit ribosomal protein S16
LRLAVYCCRPTAIIKGGYVLAVKIRLRRMGTKGKPFYRVVVADSRTARDGRFIEILGYYDPRTEPATIKINEEKALLWLNRGAQPTDTAAALLKRETIYQKFLASKKAGEPVAVIKEEAAEPAVGQVEAAPEKTPTRKRRTKAEVSESAAEVPEAVAEPEATAEPTAEPEATIAPDIAGEE